MPIGFIPAPRYLLKFGVKKIDGYPCMQSDGEARQVEVQSDEAFYWDSFNDEIFVRKEVA